MTSAIGNINGNQGCENLKKTVSCEILENILRVLSSLEKTIDKLRRRNFHFPEQCPDLIKEILNTIGKTRLWIQNYKAFSSLQTFHILLSLSVNNLKDIIIDLSMISIPFDGKKQEKQKIINKDLNKIFCSANKMLEKVAAYLDKFEPYSTELNEQLEIALKNSFEKHFVKVHEKRERPSVSSRGNKTYIFRCDNWETYMKLVNDKKKFRTEVVDKLGEMGHVTGHKPTCTGPKKYNLIGFRQIPRRTRMKGGQIKTTPLRMLLCKCCGEKFSLLPSFLPREKHFAIDIIGQVFHQMVIFGQSIQGALQELKFNHGGVKSKQTIYNWLRWIGWLHPATILTRAGVKGSGYFQEDEGFEKEPCLRTYSVIMVDPESHLVWHADYVDHVDEETLTQSFEKFLQKVEFKILGITKDKWKASTNALKKVFHKIWIGFCHRHSLHKLWQALSKYRDETKCSLIKIKTLYNKFKKVLDESTSKVSLKVKLKSLKDPAFDHPLLKQRVTDLKKNAVHYTSHRKRNGIKKSTSIVDRFLKYVKRKLRQSESFRDKECTQFLFKAMANVRNFVPYMSSAKNAYKSPFMLGQGETYDLPWIQVMNMHNAFLFTENAF
ncbi:MAG: hypothetical protein GY909_10380 [Oligoflexia bacterium]|nr:hypothetical protein [Oligoflexia bacterium]